MNTYTYGHFIFDKGAQIIHRKKDSIFIVVVQLVVSMQMIANRFIVISVH